MAEFVDAHCVLRWLSGRIRSIAVTRNVFRFCGEEVLWLLQLLAGKANAAKPWDGLTAPALEWWDADRVVARCAFFGLDEAVRAFAEPADRYLVAMCATRGQQWDLARKYCVRFVDNTPPIIAEAIRTPGGVELAKSLGFQQSHLTTQGTEHKYRHLQIHHAYRAGNTQFGFEMLCCWLKRHPTHFVPHVPYFTNARGSELRSQLQERKVPDPDKVIAQLAIASNNAALFKEVGGSTKAWIGAIVHGKVKMTTAQYKHFWPHKMNNIPNDILIVAAFVRARDLEGVKHCADEFTNVDSRIRELITITAIQSGSTHILQWILGKCVTLTPDLFSFIGKGNRVRALRVICESKAKPLITTEHWRELARGAHRTGAAAVLREALAHVPDPMSFVDVLRSHTRAWNRVNNALRCRPGHSYDFGGVQRLLLDRELRLHHAALTARAAKDEFIGGLLKWHAHNEFSTAR